MRYLELEYNGKKYTTQSDISNILKKEKFYWMIDSEVEDAKLKIQNNTIIWDGGNFYAGNWHYGIFKSGKFYGNWENGIWEGGDFLGKWQSGVNLLEI